MNRRGMCSEDGSCFDDYVFFFAWDDIEPRSLFFFFGGFFYFWHENTPPKTHFKKNRKYTLRNSTHSLDRKTYTHTFHPEIIPKPRSPTFPVLSNPNFLQFWSNHFLPFRTILIICLCGPFGWSSVLLGEREIALSGLKWSFMTSSMGKGGIGVWGSLTNSWM